MRPDQQADLSGVQHVAVGLRALPCFLPQVVCVGTRPTRAGPLPCSQITSSHDPAVKPGVYRLLDAPIWPKVPCAELPNQRCGLEKKLVEHGRSPPSCSFWCNLGRGAARIGVGMLSVATATMDFMDPLNLGGAIRYDRDGTDDLIGYINNPLGDQTYAVQPYSGIGRAALYECRRSSLGMAGGACTRGFLSTWRT